MALTQSARIPGHGPSWDEEVVPALRKRLESESRTLSRRMSAISLASVEDSPNFSSLAESNKTPSRPTTATKNTAITTQAKSSNTARARTYSQPFTSDLQLSSTMASRTRTDPARAISPRPTRIPKASRGPTVNGQSPPLPTVSPPLPTSYPTTNGYPTSTSTSSLHKPIPDLSSSNSVQMPSRMPPTLLNEPPPFSGSTSAASSLVNGFEGHGNVPPLPTRNDYTPRAVSREFSRPSHDYVRSSNDTPRPSYDYIPRKSVDPAPRLSKDSDERPFEHWYRGEVSRNGGVGELRVGRRQEMLEIANYGHAMRNGLSARQRKPKPGGQVEDNVAASGNGDARIRTRKRAGSVAGLTNKERERERGSLNLDEEHASRIGRVLDESPLTDLDGDGSDAGSGEEFYRHRDGFMPKGQHNATPIGSSQGHGTQKQEHRYETNSGNGEAMEVDADVYEAEDTFNTHYTDDLRASTPTPTMQNHPLAQDPPSSRQNGAPPATRIPGPSRQSSESRVTTPTPRGAEMQRGTSEPPSFTSASSSMGGPSHLEPPPEPPSQTPGAKKRGASPASTSAASKKSKTAVPPSTTPPPPSTSTTSTSTRSGNEKERNRTASKVDRHTASKANRAKAEAARKEALTRSQRGSVGYYPTPDEGDGEGGDMADAIPSWTQPIKAGNWDEVVLPVVARKKGMDGHYEQADGSPQPKAANASHPAPAPGTFGYDHSKYRPPRDGDIPMDEFGQTVPPPQNAPPQNPSSLVYPVHEQIFRPATPPSPAPFSHYVATPLPNEVERVAQQPVEEEEMKKGCCCVIM